MHTVLVIGGGLLLGLVFGLFGYLWGDDGASVSIALKAFIPVWLVVCGANMWVGVARAGYAVSDELPILGLVFAVPAGIAIVCSFVTGR